MSVTTDVLLDATPFICQKSKRSRAKWRHLEFCRMPVGINTLSKVLPEFYALFSHEKSSLAQQMNVRNTLAPPDYSGATIDIGKSEGTFVNKPSLSESVQESSSDILKDLELIEFEETDDLMRSMISSKPDGSDSGVTNVSMSGSVFNNCTFNFSK